jgi:putative ABC transport system ATP-binding protein
MPAATAPTDAASSACLEAIGLGKRYQQASVFAGVDLAVRPGEFVAIVGESGVGKSTLLNCLAGLDRVDAGRVSLLGRDWAQMDEPQAAAWRRARLGFVFQAFHVLPHLSVAQNVGLPLLLLGRSEPDRVEAMLAAVGLGGMGDRLPQTLSGGQLQRVAIARALVHGPSLILADEPTGNLDPRTAGLVMELLQAQTREQGAALVLVTHSHAAAGQADRLLRLTPDGIAQD